MKIEWLKSFLVASEELHFGRAAQRLEILPAALGRHIRDLESALNTRLFMRTTRNIRLTETGQSFVEDSRYLLQEFDSVLAKYRDKSQLLSTQYLRLGVIDSASLGLIPNILQQLSCSHPKLQIELVEEKTSNLIPKLKSGRIDLAIIRTRHHDIPHVETIPLCVEKVVVAMHSSHPLANNRTIHVKDIENDSIMIPHRNIRPHSYDLVMNVFQSKGFTPNIKQIADEKQTIIHLVAQNLGVAILPLWCNRIYNPNVCYIPLEWDEDADYLGLDLTLAYLKGYETQMKKVFFDVLTHELMIASEKGEVVYPK